MKRRWRGIAVLLFLIVLVAAGSPAKVTAEEALRVGVPLYPISAFPSLAASAKGFFQKNGLKVENIRINSEPTTYQALLSGDIDVAAGSGTGFVLSHLQGIGVVCLGSFENIVPYTLATREKITDIAQLRGKKIGVNRLGGKSSLILRVMLEDAGLDPFKDVTLLQLGSSQERMAALMKAGIDAAPVDYSIEPTMKRMGFFLLQGKKTFFLNGPIVFKRAYLESRRSTVKNFMKGLLEGTSYIMSNREGTLNVLSREMKIGDKETLEYIYDHMRSTADASLYPPEESVTNLLKMMAYVDKRAASVRPEKIMDYSLLEELGQKRPPLSQK